MSMVISVPSDVVEGEGILIEVGSGAGIKVVVCIYVNVEGVEVIFGMSRHTDGEVSVPRPKVAQGTRVVDVVLEVSELQGATPVLGQGISLVGGDASEGGAVHASIVGRSVRRRKEIPLLLGRDAARGELIPNIIETLEYQVNMREPCDVCNAKILSHSLLLGLLHIHLTTRTYHVTRHELTSAFGEGFHL